MCLEGDGVRNRPWVACCWGLCRDILARGRPRDWRLLRKSVARAGDSPRELTQPCGRARSLCWAGGRADCQTQSHVSGVTVGICHRRLQLDRLDPLPLQGEESSR